MTEKFHLLVLVPDSPFSDPLLFTYYEPYAPVHSGIHTYGVNAGPHSKVLVPEMPCKEITPSGWNNIVFVGS